MRYLLVLFSLLALQSGTALAQEMPACDGHIAILRVSDVKPGAMNDIHGRGGRKSGLVPQKRRDG